MTPAPEPSHRLRKVVLPSGKTLEILSFGEQSACNNQPGSQPAPGALHLCRDCGCDLVFPVSWEPAPQGWELELRCPNCESWCTETFEQAQVSALEEELDRGTQELVADLRALTDSNMEAEIKNFAAALVSDLILPIDF